MAPRKSARFCGDCNKLVHDLSSMSESRARQLLEQSSESLCVRYLHDQTGEIWFAEDFARRTAKERLRAGALATALSIPALVQACGGAGLDDPYDAATPDAARPDARPNAASPDAAPPDAAPDAVTNSKPLEHCVPGDASACGSQSHCVEGCPSSALPAGNASGGICTGAARESCGCGVNPTPCTTPGLECLLPSCCDYEGLCVTPEERAAICKGPDAVRFACK
jgi:hypothetical protein